MSESLSYEVYIRRGDEWIVETVSKSRQSALGDAERLFEQHVAPAVKVVEDRYSSETGNAVSVTICHMDREPKARARTAAQSRSQPEFVERGPRIVNYKPGSSKRPWEILVQRLMILVVIVGGICIGTLVGVAFLMDSETIGDLYDSNLNTSANTPSFPTRR